MRQTSDKPSFYRVISMRLIVTASAVAHAGDVLDKPFFDRVVPETVEQRGAVDILVKNAGIIRDNLLEKITPLTTWPPPSVISSPTPPGSSPVRSYT
jgi:NAD(P)-dependent dehydrogenase (short-subunit alcohol dehydrogenase family)